MFQLAGEQEDSLKLAEEKLGESMDSVDESSYIFTANKLPNQRQLFYQLCDLRDESLQRIIHSNDGTEAECTVRESRSKVLMKCLIVADNSHKAHQ